LSSTTLQQHPLPHQPQTQTQTQTQNQSLTPSQHHEFVTGRQLQDQNAVDQSSQNGGAERNFDDFQNQKISSHDQRSHHPKKYPPYTLPQINIHTQPQPQPYLSLATATATASVTSSIHHTTADQEATLALKIKHILSSSPSSTWAASSTQEFTHSLKTNAPTNFNGHNTNAINNKNKSNNNHHQQIPNTTTKNTMNVNTIETFLDNPNMYLVHLNQQSQSHNPQKQCFTSLFQDPCQCSTDPSLATRPTQLCTPPTSSPPSLANSVSSIGSSSGSHGSSSVSSVSSSGSGFYELKRRQKAQNRGL
jgi:hypothetical protein